MTRLLALALLAGLGVSGRAHAQTYIWPGDAVGNAGGNGVSGNWGDPRWRLSTAPGVDHAPPTAADSVSALNGATAFTLDVTDARGITNLTFGNANANLRILVGGSLAVSGALTQSAGALTVNSTLTVNGTYTQGGGTIQGTGGMTLSGPLTWNGNANLAGSATLTSPIGSTFTNHVTLSGSNTLNLNAPVAGSATHSWNSHTFTLNGTSVVNVGAGATFVTVANQALGAASGTPTLNIAGTFRKQTGTAETIFGGGAVPLAVNNSGTIAVESGVLRFLNATLTNTGTLSSTSPGIISFTDNSVLNLNTGSLGQGTGLIRLASSSATANVNAATTITAFELSNGTFQGTQTLTAAGALTVAGGTLTGTAILKGTNGGSVGNATVNTGTLQLAGGTFNWNQNLTYSGSGLIQIDSAATLDMTGDRGLTRTAGSPALLINGTLAKTGGTGNGVIEPSIAVTVGATGVINVQSGTLRVRSNVTNNGTLRANFDGRLEFDTLITLTGSGLVDVAGGTLLTTHTGTITVPAGMSFTNAGVVQIQSGTLNIASANPNLTNYSGGTLTGGTWRVGNGTLNLNARPVSTIAPGTLVEVLSGGTFTGINSLTQNNGLFRIANGATVGPTGTINNAGIMEVSGTLNGAVTVQDFGVLAGRGTVNGNVTVQSGGQITPGPGPYSFPGTAQLSLGATALNGGSVYTWEVNSWVSNPTAGSHFDQIRGGSGGVDLNLAGASSANRITLRIVSLSGSDPGLISGFDPQVARSWVIADFSNGNPTNGVQSFSADKFTLDTALFANEENSAQFSLSLDANSNRIILTYTPVPEPSAVLLVAAAGLCVRRLRRCV